MATPKYLPTDIPSWMQPSNSVGGNYSAAVNTQAGDYDRIMRGYEGLLSGIQNTKTNIPSFSPLTARSNTFTPAGYQRSGGLDSSFDTLNKNSRTGGYSEDDINNIRARGVSPIRAVYANAMQNLARQKSLQGGYSPNYGALQAKMAREQSSMLSDKTTDVNANIAEMVAKGKTGATNTLAQLSSRENDTINALNASNAAGVDKTNTDNTAEAARIDQFNQSMAMQLAQLGNNANMGNQGQQLATLGGMQSLYGTTPALAATFGQQALAAGGQNIAANQAVNQQNNARAGMGINLINSLPPIRYNNSYLGTTRRG